MKKHLPLLLLCLCLSAPGPSRLWAGQAAEILGELPNGQINWSQGFLDVKSSFFMARQQTDQDSASPGEKESRARRQITPILMQNLALIKINASQYVSDLITQDVTIRDKLGEMAQAAPITTFEEQPDGRVEIGVQMQLNGGFAQLILPSDIKQVETIKAVSSADTQSGESAQPDMAPGNATEAKAYTGLIVDARGIGAQPALAPVLTAENGKEVYGPAFISREYAVHNGICSYVRSIGDADQSRTGANPLVVKGLRTVKGKTCDIVISNADASRLLGSSAHLAFLKECRVVIVLD